MDIKIILASKSPRRQYLLKELRLNFEVKTNEVEEYFPQGLKPEKVAMYLAKLKADALNYKVKPNEVILSADTVVTINDELLGKPENYGDAVNMLRKLSDCVHKVITGVHLKTRNKEKSFFSETKVWFKELSIDEITYYVKNYEPYDKAGGYGIQEWIGYIGIEKIEGSYFNVMGLPVKEVYDNLKLIDAG